MSQQTQLSSGKDDLLSALEDVLGELGKVTRGIDVETGHGKIVFLHVRLKLLGLFGDLLCQSNHS